MYSKAPLTVVIKLSSHKLHGIFGQLTKTYRKELCSKEFLRQLLLTTAISDAQCSLHSLIGTAPRYGLDVAGIEFLWGDVGAHQASCTKGTCFLSRGKASGSWL
jgi:hypothetical protein